MTKGNTIRYCCPNPDCKYQVLKNTGFRGGRWCPKCNYSFTIFNFGIFKDCPEKIRGKEE